MRKVSLDIIPYAGNYIKLFEGDCRINLQYLKPDSVHLIITDPPYFLNGLDDEWSKGQTDSVKGTGSVGGLPVGMKFDSKQGRELQKFIHYIGELMIPAICPGGFVIVFSQPRLSHRMAVGLEDAGFDIRDLYAWHFTGKSQSKAFSMDHFIDKMEINDIEKQQYKQSLNGRKTPQLRPQFEIMIIAQKPKIGTFVENWLKYETGLIDSNVRLDGYFPTTLMNVEKHKKELRDIHLTPKPVALLRHLIQLFSIKSQVVLDPFVGSGSTAVAAMQTERSCIGMEINPKYIELTKQKLTDEKQYSFTFSEEY